jgi:AcrR family transcriptional regulator
MIMKEDKRKEIRDIAARLFAEKGFEKTSTRDISKAAGLSDAGLYYHFESKQSLLFEILDQILITGLEVVREIDLSDQRFEEKLTAYTRFYTRYYSPEIDKLKLLVEEQKKVNQEQKRKLDEVQREYLDILVRILDGLKEENKMADMDTTVSAFAFFSMVHWVYRWYNPQGKVTPEQLSEIFYRIISRGISPLKE